MDITETAAGGAEVAILSGRLDAASAAATEARLLGMIGKGRPLVVDLAGVGYVSSAGLRALLKAAKQAQSAKTGFALAAPQAPVREVLETSGFDAILGLHATREAAAASLG
jgi:anti-sigma B factor antagonist